MNVSCWQRTIRDHWQLPLIVQLLKLECLVQMSGRHGRDIAEKWRREDGSLSIPVPQCDMRINVVDRYRHLGTIVMANGNDVPNARLRAKSAKEAYGPLAFRIFGPGHIPAPLKLSLYMCLVESRNSFSMHALRIVASVNNRALRRTAGTPRFERDEHALSDLEVRRTLKVPSYDCILMRGRLRYVGRIVRTTPTTLVAMLSIRTGEPPAPPEWFVRVQEDLHSAWKTVAVGSDSEICAFLRVGIGQQSCHEEDGCSNVEQGLRVQWLQQER